jgi:hypothetical protein
MREFDKDSQKMEATFEVSKKVEDETTNKNGEFDEVEEFFLRIL